jgi:hypothetical protein
MKLFALQVDDELKKIKPKDPKLMTARQRAMFERKTDKEPSPGGEQLLALPSGKLSKSFHCHCYETACLPELGGLHILICVFKFLCFSSCPCIFRGATLND